MRERGNDGNIVRESENAGNIVGERENAGNIMTESGNAGIIVRERENAGNIVGKRENAGNIVGKRENAGNIMGESRNAGNQLFLLLQTMFSRLAFFWAVQARDEFVSFEHLGWLPQINPLPSYKNFRLVHIECICRLYCNPFPNDEF